jgi:hypothetical protein
MVFPTEADVAIMTERLRVALATGDRRRALNALRAVEITAGSVLRAPGDDPAAEAHRLMDEAERVWALSG